MARVLSVVEAQYRAVHAKSPRARRRAVEELVQVLTRDWFRLTALWDAYAAGARETQEFLRRYPQELQDVHIQHAADAYCKLVWLQREGRGDE